MFAFTLMSATQEGSVHTARVRHTRSLLMPGPTEPLAGARKSKTSPPSIQSTENTCAQLK